VTARPCREEQCGDEADRGGVSGRELLLNWVETDNYKTIAAAALGYNHCVVAQSPIDVNMSKQLNILLTNMGVSADRIVVDP